MKLSNTGKVFTTRALLALVILCLLPLSSHARRKWQPEMDDLAARVERIERLLDSQGLQEMYQRLELLDQENRTLRGDLEQLQYQLEHMMERNRQIYLDMDQRLQNLEGGQPPAMPGMEGADGVEGGMSPDAGASMMAPSQGGMAGAAPQLGTAVPASPAAAGATAAEAAAQPGMPVADQGMDEQTQYRMAFEQLKQRQFKAAIRSFDQFLKQYPYSQLAPNAWYWMGEASYADGAFQQAANFFEKVLKDYPESPKADDAALKLGYTYYEMKKWAKARVALKDLMMKSSGSTVGRLAAERLKRMKREGH